VKRESRGTGPKARMQIIAVTYREKDVLVVFTG